jgi:hypothetical protein
MPATQKIEFSPTTHREKSAGVEYARRSDRQGAPNTESSFGTTSSFGQSLAPRVTIGDSARLSTGTTRATNLVAIPSEADYNQGELESQPSGNSINAFVVEIQQESIVLECEVSPQSVTIALPRDLFPESCIYFGAAVAPELQAFGQSQCPSGMFASL